MRSELLNSETSPYLTHPEKVIKVVRFRTLFFEKQGRNGARKTIATDDSCQGMFGVIRIVTKCRYPDPFYSCDLQPKLAGMTGEGGKAAIP